MSAGHSSNGLAPASRSWKHLRIDRRSRGYCHVTFDHPPLNAVTAATVAELAELIGLIEHDPDLNVVVFGSGNPEVYLAPVAAEPDPGHTAESGTGPTAGWIDVLGRLSRSPVVSIAAIRGRAGGAGSEFVLACDLRFGSRENTRLGRIDLGLIDGDGNLTGGALPSGGPAARLCALVGRARTLEILLLAGDLDGPRAERYGYVNRLVADDRLDAEVDAMARELEWLDHDAIARTKRGIDHLTSRFAG